MHSVVKRSGTRRSDSFDLKYLLVKSKFRRAPKEGTSTRAVVSAHLSNTTAKRRDVAKQLVGQLKNIAEENG